MSKITGIKPGEILETDFSDTLQKGVPPAERTVFYYTPLSAFDNARIQDELYQVSGFGKARQERFLTGTQQIAVLERGLKGWSNFKYGDGSDIEWEDPSSARNDKERKDMMLRNIDKIPQEVRAELTDLIRGESSAEQD